MLSIYTNAIVKSLRETGHGKTLTRKTHNHSDNASRRRRTTRTIGALINVAALLAICLSIALTALVRFWKPVAVDDLGALVAVSALGLVASVAMRKKQECSTIEPVEGAEVDATESSAGQDGTERERNDELGNVFAMNHAPGYRVPT